MAKATITSPAGALKTGNAKGARKPGKAARYLLTQDAADAIGEIGRAVADADDFADFALSSLAEGLREYLEPLAGKVDDNAAQMWAHIRAAFIAGYCDARDVDAPTAGRAWLRAIAPLKLEKAQSEAAAKKAQQRAAKAPSGDDGEASGETGETPMDGAGEEAVQAVQMGLSKIEAHIIGLLRAGKVTLATQCIADTYTN